MSKIQIFLEPNESREQAESDLIKALNHHSSGGAHLEDQFDDSATNHASILAKKMHSDMYRAMLDEIFEVLQRDFDDRK